MIFIFTILSFQLFSYCLCSGCGNTLIPDLTFRLSGSEIIWPCPATKSSYVSAGKYIPSNVIVTRAQIYMNLVFLAIPRYRPGVPITLGVTELQKGGGMISIRPYPCWSFQEEGTSNALQSVVDIFMDIQNILWVLDSGLVNNLDIPIRRSQPKVLAFDVTTGRLRKNIDLAPLSTSASKLQYIVVDYDNSGVIFVYISDAGTKSILVVNCATNKKSRVRITDRYSPIGPYNTYDVLYIALIRKLNGLSYLYATFLSDNMIYAINVSDLQNGITDNVIYEVGKKAYNSSIIVLGTNNLKSIFFRYKGDTDIYLWDTDEKFNSRNFHQVHDGNRCRFSTHVFPGSNRFMWTIESNFLDFVRNKVSSTGVSMVIQPIAKHITKYIQ